MGLCKKNQLNWKWYVYKLTKYHNSSKCYQESNFTSVEIMSQQIL